MARINCFISRFFKNDYRSKASRKFITTLIHPVIGELSLTKENMLQAGSTFQP